MMDPAGCFDYVVDIPEGGKASSPWRAQTSSPVSKTERSLVGHSPIVTLDDFEMRLGVLRTRITLTASDDRAVARQASFTVERGFADMLRPADVLHVVRTIRGGLAVSVLRNGLLIAAAGTVSHVPLGGTVIVRQPGDLARQAEAIFRTRDSTYELWEVPVEVTVERETRLLHRARMSFGRYEVFVVHGFVLRRECVAITLVGVCPDCAATLTAPLLDAPAALQVAPLER